jgi:hypothetical protein
MTSTTSCRSGNTCRCRGSPTGLGSRRSPRSCRAATARVRGRRFDLGPELGHAFPMICYEAIFPGYIRHRRPRPDWMVHVTNDAWFGTFLGPVAAPRPRPPARGRTGAAGAARGEHRGLRRDRCARSGSRRPSPERSGVSRHAPAPPLPPTLYARTGDWPSCSLRFFGLVRSRCGKPFRNGPLNPPARRVSLRDPTTASWRGDTRIMEHPHGTRQLPLHLRIRFGGASRQGLRPDFRRRSRRVHRRGTRGARRLRNLRHHPASS